MLKIFSHPRSGTHFLEAFVAKNFYPNKNLLIENLTWGHWSNRKKEKQNPYGKLFGSHQFPIRNYRLKPSPILYIYRDGRAVAYSIWKTPNFLNEQMSNLSFSDFLRTPLDWHGSPKNASKNKLTIIEHWAKHVEDWHTLKGNIVYISYEDLVDNPEKVYFKILYRCFPYKFSKIFGQTSIEVIEKPLGLKPNKGTKNEWKKIFTEKDLTLFQEICPNWLFKKYENS